MVRRTTTTSTTTTTTTNTLNNNNNTIIPPKKKKGRPSLLDLQKRKLLQQQQQQQNPNSQSRIPNQSNPINHLHRRPRSTRRIPNLPAHFIDGSDSDDHSLLNSQHSDDDDDDEEDDDEGVDDDDDDDERAQKKVKLVVQFPNSKFNNVALQDEKGSKATDNENGTRRMLGALEAGPTASTSTATETTTTTSTPLPDKKLLLLILDRLQKKDTRGVFAEPVDPEELPDYHEIIENPMDFDTVRKKLMGGLYIILEQLEDDINLICSNAMQYNAPSTVFFRQARAIQELAKKEFETLRQPGGLSELPTKPRRGRPPGSRNLKKLLEKKSSPPDRSLRESSSDATPASREEDPTKSASYNLRKGPTSSSKSMSTKYGKRPCGSDESRRETYYLSGASDSSRDPQFLPNLGPDVWRIASKKIASVLPPGIEFGPGWVGENENKLVSSNSVSHDYSKSEPHFQSTSGFENSGFTNNPPISCSEKLVEQPRELSSSAEWSSQLKSGNGVAGPSSSLQTQHRSSVYPHMNGLNGGFGSGSQYQEATARLTSSSTSFNPHALDSGSFDGSRNFHGVNSENDMVTHGMPYWQNLSMQERWDRPYPVELNGGFQAFGSKSSNLPIGSPPQLDLVLQL
ncbi:Bromodomain and PHD finger-containing protein 3 [Bienertia sinuspersici]